MMGAVQNWLKKQAERDAMVTSMQALLDAAPHDDRITITKVRKISRNAVIFLAEQQGRPVFVKRYTHDRGPDRIRATEAEIATVSDWMTPSEARVCSVIHADAANAYIVLEAAAGLQVAALLREDTGPLIAPVLQRVGHWLTEYIGPRREMAVMGPGHWIKELRSLPSDHLPADVRTLVQRAIRLQQARAKPLRNAPLIRAAVPSDFAPHNLHYDATMPDGRVWGFDIEGETWRPLSRSLAQFAVLLDCQNLPPASDRLYGVDSRLLTPLLQTCPTDPAEATPVMEFFVTTAQIERLITRFDTTPRTERLYQALQLHLRSG